jgi:hypothetical protein
MRGNGYGRAFQPGALAIDNTWPHAIVCGVSNWRAGFKPWLPALSGRRILSITTARLQWRQPLGPHDLQTIASMAAAMKITAKGAPKIDDSGNYMSLQASISGRM